MVVSYFDQEAQWRAAPTVEPWPDVDPEYTPIPSKPVDLKGRTAPVLAVVFYTGLALGGLLSVIAR